MNMIFSHKSSRLPMLVGSEGGRLIIQSFMHDSELLNKLRECSYRSKSFCPLVGTIILIYLVIRQMESKIVVMWLVKSSLSSQLTA